MRRMVAFLVVVASALGFLLILGPSASAHAVLRDSTPKGGELLDVPPTEVVADFTEPPDLGLSDMTVVATHGHTIELGSSSAFRGKGTRSGSASPRSRRASTP